MNNQKLKIIVGVVVLVVIVIVVFFVSGSAPPASRQIINHGDIVEVEYVGTLENGEIFDQSASTTPLQFTVGSGQMIVGFDEAVIGMKIGETKNISLAPEKAYGTTTTVSLLEQMSIQFFKDELKRDPVLNEKIRPENAPWAIDIVKISDTEITIKNNPEAGVQYAPHFKVFEVNNETNEMKIGHSLAGQTLNFKITALRIVDKCEAMAIEKRDKPTVDVFVMSHCPYGTQVEKGIIPVQKLLGGKADINIKFVHYIMHGKKEADEQTKQYCIDKEQKNKFWSYLECFLENGDSKNCLEINNVDMELLENCIKTADTEFSITKNLNNATSSLPVFKIHESLSIQYGVQGSPTVVVNGKTIETQRDSESLKQAICCGFTNKPRECQQSLATTTPSAGFGFQTSPQDNNAPASCVN